MYANTIFKKIIIIICSYNVKKYLFQLYYVLLIFFQFNFTNNVNSIVLHVF